MATKQSADGPRGKKQELQSLKAKFSAGTLDEQLTRVCLEDSVGDIVRRREQTNSAKGFFVADLIMSAIFEFDMNLVVQIVNRIDGPVASEKDLENCANIMGGALEDVLNLQSKDQMVVRPDDPVIIGIAKVVFVAATAHPKKGSAARKDKQIATELILNRCGGRREEPTRVAFETKYVEPEWMATLDAPKDQDSSTESASES